MFLKGLKNVSWIEEISTERDRGGEVFSDPVNHSNPPPLKRDIFLIFGKWLWG